MIYTKEEWPWGRWLCRITESAKDVSIGVSVFTLTALSAERYCAIVNPLRKLQVIITNYNTSFKIWKKKTNFQNIDETVNRIYGRYDLDSSDNIRYTGVYCVGYGSTRFGKHYQSFDPRVFTIRCRGAVSSNLCKVSIYHIANHPKNHICIKIYHFINNFVGNMSMVNQW